MGNNINIKFLVSGIMNKDEKTKYEEMGLYCYDLRDSDDGRDISSIEKRVIGPLLSIIVLLLGNRCLILAMGLPSVSITAFTFVRF